MGPALIVKDANGAFVGIGDTRVRRRVGNVVLSFGVSTDGRSLLPVGTANTWVYESADCSGLPLVQDDPPYYGLQGQVGSTLFLDSLEGPGRALYYVTGPTRAAILQSQNINPSVHATSQADCTGLGGCSAFFAPPDQCCCTNPPNSVTDAAPSQSVDAAGAALGLVPPFHVEGP